MIILKTKEFGKKNKGGGKIKTNLSTNKQYTSEAKKQAEKELEKVLTEQKAKDEAAAKKLAQAVKESKITKKAAGSAIKALKNSKKVLIPAAIATTVVGTGAVVAKNKKSKNVGKVKAFSTREILEDTSTAAGLGAAGGLGYAGYHGAKALHEMKKAAGNGGSIKEQYKIIKKATPEQVEKGLKSSLSNVKAQAKAAKALQKAGKGTKYAATAAAASIIAGTGAKLLGKKGEESKIDKK